MIVEGYIPQVNVETVVDGQDLAHAVRAFREEHPGAVIGIVDDRIVIGMCEACGLPVFDGDAFGFDDVSNVYVHKACD